MAGVTALSDWPHSGFHQPGASDMRRKRIGSGWNIMIWLKTILGRRHASAKRDSSDWLLHREEFQSCLERERMRVDRNAGVFSLMVITCRDNSGEVGVEHLAGVLKGRIRKTDTAGWFNGRSLGVILPDTNSHGAFVLARDLSAFYGDDAATPQFDIYTHPADEQIPGFPQQVPVELGQLVEAASNGRSVGDNGWRTQGRKEPHVAKFVRTDLHDAYAKSSLVSQPIETLMVQRHPIWKRSVDIVGSLVGLTALSPLLALTAVAIKRSSPGPIIFAQKREGLGGRIFTMYKFRTMCTDAEALKAQLRSQSEQDGPAFKLTHDPRVTPLGSFLRKTCIDELPQLWNVLRGEMSLVGPRPLPVDESRNCKPWQRRRLTVKPGLTCIWQVEGGINVTFDQWMRMDLTYAATHSPASDVRLLWKTFTKVLLRRASR
jgi:lipopolysaccharide/colanic/teichoic acid biosynthesis glycosyltransferase